MEKSRIYLVLLHVISALVLLVVSGFQLYISGQHNVECHDTETNPEEPLSVVVGLEGIFGMVLGLLALGQIITKEPSVVVFIVGFFVLLICAYIAACLELYEPSTEQTTEPSTEHTTEPSTEHTNLYLPGCDASFTAVQWLTHGVLIAATIAVIPLTATSCCGIKSYDKVSKDSGESLVKGTEV